MKLRRRPSPLLVLLIPSLSSLAITALAKPGSNERPDALLSPRDAAAQAAAAGSAEQSTLLAVPTSVSKPGIGTKDAPVDGKDGKPHDGPWVDLSDKDKKKLDQNEGEKPLLSGKKPSPKPLRAPENHAPEIPEVNDGVMDDPYRESPKEGTTGTEGGVSEKNRERKAQEGQTGEKMEMRPESPKEAPPIPPSEEDRIKWGKEDSKEIEKEALERPKGAFGLEKPSDLPEKPHDIAHPEPPSSKKDPVLHDHHSSSSSKPPLSTEESTGLIQPLHSFALSLTMILFSEIGDKTFLIAALMAMKHPRLLVFSAAFSALITMTVLSAVLGHAVPTLIPKRLTNYLAAVLFLVFGGRLLREGLAMHPDEGVGEEMKEVEQELEEKAHIAGKRRRSSVSPYMLESGRGSRKSRSATRLPSPRHSPSSSSSRSSSPRNRRSVYTTLSGLNNLLSLLLSPAWVQTFVMTFLGEWGDRSQIATIAMAAGQDYWWVTVGAVMGHAACTTVAVIGGRAIAGKVSLRVVTLGGAIAFICFGVIYLAEAFYYS
ncbi:hypothetical protein FGG08_004601 [Glutinoglossum americanum]|uniref:Uncharacterized protein n=1 Tax=Glutinoglossum americanum TaxID=1670608 RepID=A0A9P8IB25_9PEZI|nr:hypothetical protein FGG08_004601 [Glutinoglossum americanum]